MRILKVQTEDGYVLDLWHVYDPKGYTPLPSDLRGIRGPESIDAIRPPPRKHETLGGDGKKKYPILMIHGLLQTAGVFAANDEHSLAFWLCKEGFDGWLVNCRAGFVPEHVEVENNDPQMWNWDRKPLSSDSLRKIQQTVTDNL